MVRHFDYTQYWLCFDQPHVLAVPLYTPTSTPLVPKDKSTPEIVLFVGYPSSGKTSLYKRYFEPEGYVHVNQDTLKSKPKCLKAVADAIGEKKSCIVGELMFA
jgi:bifunctional polynucleotide phosphatase/kinase